MTNVYKRMKMTAMFPPHHSRGSMQELTETEYGAIIYRYSDFDAFDPLIAATLALTHLSVD